MAANFSITSSNDYTVTASATWTEFVNNEIYAHSKRSFIADLLGEKTYIKPNAIWKEKANNTITSTDWKVRYSTNTTACESDWRDNYITTSGTNTITWSVDDNVWWRKCSDEVQRVDPKQKLREIIAQRQFPEIIICNNDRRKALGNTDDPREIRARQTLLTLIGPEQYQRYLKNGFVAVQGMSGRVFQLFPKQHLARIFERGRHIGQVCIYLNEKFPPTDQVITWLCMVQNNEEEFIGMGNAQWFKQDKFVTNRLRVREVQPLNQDLKLAEIYDKIKAKQKIKLVA